MNRRAYVAGAGIGLSGALGGCLESASIRSSPSGASGEFELTDLTASTSVDRPPGGYALERSASYSADAVTREEERTGEERVVVDISEVDDDEVREALEVAIETGEWRSETLPDGLEETVETVDFVTGVTTGTYTHVGLALHHVDPDRSPAIEFGATITDAAVSEDGPGAIDLELTNAGSTGQEVFSGTVPPFGMVRAESVDEGDEFLLWREYEEEGCYGFDGSGWIRCDIGAITPIQPDETLSRRYEVLPGSTSHYPDQTVPPGPGTYRIADALTYSEGGGAPGMELSFEAEFVLESV
ncbi:hypothetical protein [Natronorubrum halophilum]|uniref:hypothetical protein n=1 Tax=Natronorubrum halophilum TaxID=1702106 RepID=UPI0010C23AC8|nr:hypothetical protein [Natronorubrum halophilum]